MTDEQRIGHVAGSLASAINVATAVNYLEGSHLPLTMFIMQIQHSSSWIGWAQRDAYAIGDRGCSARARELIDLVEAWCRGHHQRQLEKLYRRKSTRRPKSVRSLGL